jgi:hypothetical protein
MNKQAHSQLSNRLLIKRSEARWLIQRKADSARIG